MKATKMTCNRCKVKTTYYCIEWPAKVVACGNCSCILVLAAYDPSRELCSYYIAD